MTTVRSATKRLLAIRHAPTLSAGLCFGDSDVSCTVSPPDAAAEILAQVAGETFTCVWSSPRERCSEPAGLVARALGIPLRIDHRLCEISFGDWEQQKWTDIEATMPEQFQSWMNHWLTQAPPHGELPAQLAQRVQSWWSDLASGNHLLVSHAGVQRALRVILRGLTWAEAMQLDIPHLKGERFHIDENRFEAK